MCDFENILSSSAMAVGDAKETVNAYGCLILGCGDWREKIKQDEFKTRRELAAALVYKNGDTKTVKLPGGAEMELIYCAPGSFQMGDGREERHEVQLTKGFWLGRYPVTVGQWKSVVLNGVPLVKRLFAFISNDVDLRDWERTKSQLSLIYPKDCDRIPVSHVSWVQCRNFIERLNRFSGLKARFPTEAEWEYACRAGDKTNNINNVEQFANIVSRYSDTGIFGILFGGDGHTVTVGEPRAVGMGRPNNWGFYDMLGNVREWCFDVYDEFRKGKAIDPKGPLSGAVHVVRGTSRGDSPGMCVPSMRLKEAEGQIAHIGLRLAFDTDGLEPTAEHALAMSRLNVSDDKPSRWTSFMAILNTTVVRMVNVVKQQFAND